MKPETYNWAGKTILIAEDEDVNYFFLEELLEETHVKILHAENGVEAIEISLNTPIDLILMDIKMPKKNGIDATIEIKKTNKNIPIIAQTAFSFVENEIKSLEAGCDDYLTKPIEKSELLRTLYKYLNNK